MSSALSAPESSLGWPHSFGLQHPEEGVQSPVDCDLVVVGLASSLNESSYEH